LNRGQLQAWALNRYYYQSHIPAKDATLIAELHHARRRPHDHGEGGPNTGGLERGLRLSHGLGLDHDYVISTAGFQDTESVNADRIGGFGGGHARKLTAARAVTQSGLAPTSNFVVHRQNLTRVPEMIDLAETMGPVAWRSHMCSITVGRWPIVMRCCRTVPNWTARPQR
jgi:hypothetical protein